MAQHIFINGKGYAVYTKNSVIAKDRKRISDLLRVDIIYLINGQIAKHLVIRSLETGKAQFSLCPDIETAIRQEEHILEKHRSLIFSTNVEECRRIISLSERKLEVLTADQQLMIDRKTNSLAIIANLINHIQGGIWKKSYLRSQVLAIIRGIESFYVYPFFDFKTRTFPFRELCEKATSNRQYDYRTLEMNLNQIRLILEDETKDEEPSDPDSTPPIIKTPQPVPA